MSGKLPPDFDAQRYLASYPDVPLSGLDPAVHYLRFGRLMGRNPGGMAATPKSGPEALPPPKAPKSTEISNSDDQKAAPAESSPIIDRPNDFSPAEVSPIPGAPKGNRDAAGSISLETLALGPFASAKERERLCGPLVAYARMAGLDLPANLSLIKEVTQIGAGIFACGETRVENAWFAGGDRVRLMIAGGSGVASASKGWALRSYQAHPGKPGDLGAAGEGIQFPASGPIFHDVELLHPLMPLLLELSDVDGLTRGIALLPFPSLLPGGIHGTELRALQADPNPMDAFWSLSDMLLRELLGAPDWPARSVARLSVQSDGAEDIVQISSPEFMEWLSALFGLSVEPAGQSSSNARKIKKCDEGLNLVLPADCVPTISTLVSRRLGGGNDAVAAPFLVAELPGHRPRWSVTLPAGHELNSGIPVLRGTGRQPSARTSPNPVPIHVAIAQRPAPDVLQVPGSQTQRVANPGQPIPLTVVLDASDARRTETVVRAIRQSTGDEVQFLVHGADGDDALRDVLDRTCGAAGWTATEGEELVKLARGACHDLLLTISDRVNFDDRGVLTSLSAILAGDQNVASVACLLLGEARFKNETVLQPATGGLFPAGVSFARSPRLTFFEPDVLQALPEQTYSVVANTFLLTLWRTRPLAELADPMGPIQAPSRDIRLGLDLMAAGYRNLCTTQVKANLSGFYVRRDAIDPLGSAYLQPRDWEEVLSKVTVLRELF
jgi:hypothetical protein